MRRAAAVDGNQGEIVRALRAVGVWVHVTSRLGDGFPDLLTWFQGRFSILELKDPAQCASKRRLTPAEKRFHASCPGPIHVVESAAEAFVAVGIRVLPNGSVVAR